MNRNRNIIRIFQIVIKSPQRRHLLIIKSEILLSFMDIVSIRGNRCNLSAVNSSRERSRLTLTGGVRSRRPCSRLLRINRVLECRRACSGGLTGFEAKPSYGGLLVVLEGDEASCGVINATSSPVRARFA